MRIAVVFHLGRTSDWAYYASFFRNIPRPFDLYVTHPAVSIPPSVARQLVLPHHPQPDILSIEDRGMDTGAFLIAMARILCERRTYDVILKFHTKRQWPPPYHEWRNELMNAILRSPKIAYDCMRLVGTPSFRTGLPPTGIVGCQKWIRHEGYRKDVDDYAKSVGFGEQRESRFIGGTMFWCRFAPLAKALQGKDLMGIASRMPVGKSLGDSEPHFLERILCNLIVTQGYSIESVSP